MLIDGLPAPDGTVITAMVGGVQVAAVEVEDGKYTNLQVALAGEFVTFKIGNAVANQTFVSAVGGVDLSAEENRLRTELDNCRKSVQRVETLVANPDFRNKARPEVVENEEERLRSLQEEAQRLEEIVAQLSGR